MIGNVIGQYRIVAQVGRGTAGTVYKAIDESLNREVAIKVLNPDLAGTEVMKRFRTEATALARLNHPAIATIHELFRSGGDLLMVMEFVRGETLEHLSRRLGALEPERAAYVIDQVLWGVGHAHAAGIVHRDLKPANVMLTAAGAVKIMDFGIARVRGSEHVTADGCMLGTPAYMAPEQILGNAVDGRADLYSIGVIFYRLLTGALPFQVETPMQMLQKQIADPPEPMQNYRQDLPDWCDSIVRRTLAKSPGDRFQTADEFREAITHGARILTRTDLAADLAQVAEDVQEVPPTPLPSQVRSKVVDAPTMVLKKTPPIARSAALAVAAAVVGVLAYEGLWRAGTDQSMTPAAAAPSSSPAAVTSGTTSSATASSGAVSPDVTPPLAGPQATVSHTQAAGAPADASAGNAALAAAAAAQRNTAPAAAPVTETRTTPAAVRVSREASVDGDEATLVKRAIPTLPPLVFETKALLPSGKNHKEHDAHLALSDGRIRVATDNDGRERVLHTVPYDEITSISYSRGRDPVWMSPDGPATVARVGAGAFGLFRRDRHWITLQTNTKQRFVILRTSESSATKVLAALEARTGRRAQVVGARGKDE